MKATLLIPLMLTLPLASCDKAKELAEQASKTLREKIFNRTGSKQNTDVDPELQKLVDQTPEGVVFRKDVPFPKQLEVRTTRKQDWSGRFYQSSAIERRVETLKGTRTIVEKIEHKGDEVRHTLEKSGFSVPSAEKPGEMKETLKDPLAAIAGANRTIIFRKSATNWSADPGGGFLSAALAKDLAPVLDQLLVESALAPRPLWFSSKKRLKPGDELTLTGETLAMLIGGNATGTLRLKLDGFEPVHKHPCAVFSVSGDYRRKDVPDFEGVFTDEDVTIQSGRLWLSLVYPILLKEELDTIQTVSTGSRGGQKSRGQGSIKVNVDREWKVTGP